MTIVKSNWIKLFFNVFSRTFLFGTIVQTIKNIINNLKLFKKINIL